MEEITRINHYGLRVHNLATARAFYAKLGFEFIAGPLGPEPVAIMEHPSGINVNFILNAASPAAENVLMDTPVKHAGYTHIALEVNNIEAVIIKLDQLNMPITGDMTHPTGRSIFIRDPDLNVVEFIAVLTSDS